MRRLIEWANILLAALSGAGNPEATDTLGRALARFGRRRRTPPAGERES
jgi:hypothetical protein